MLILSELREIIDHQRQKILNLKSHQRQLIDELEIIDNYALVISGIRRCGKSTLLSQLIKQQNHGWLYLNFDTPRLFNFEFKDFRLLDQIISENDIKTLYFDEIQVVNQWEIYVRGKLDEGYQVVVTGSNASMLSRELGTKLTGRHITKELFPFSYREFCEFQNMDFNHQSLNSYLEIGGMPQYISSGNTEVLHTLVNDILYRDIAVRYNIRNDRSLRHLIMFLVANVGNLISANKLKTLIGVKSVNTIQEYLSFFEAGYLIQLGPRFNYSYRVQLVNPRKIYFIDNGIQAAISPSFSPDWGQRLENMVFWELRRQNFELFYYNENNAECDFVVTRNGDVQILIQVCQSLNADNMHREAEGLTNAMEYFNLLKGYIITLNQRDTMVSEEKSIEVIPAYNLEELFCS
ncbi:MAG TPA: ATP-binding protein [Tenuifilaceae bacterium]|nr:ATP-binding protein [Tenuifilaceae bacterium]